MYASTVQEASVMQIYSNQGLVIWFRFWAFDVYFETKIYIFLVYRKIVNTGLSLIIKIQMAYQYKKVDDESSML